MTQVQTMAIRQGRSERVWPQWVFFIAFLLLAVESVLLAIVFKGTLLVMLAPGLICLMKSLELWRVLRRRLRL